MGLVSGELMELSTYVRDVLQEIADKPIDTGGGMDQLDLWVTIDGVEYYVTISQKSKKDGN